MKSNYKITLNWQGELHTFYTSSRTEKIALSNAILQLANKLAKDRVYVKRSFFGQKDNFKVERR